MDEIFAKLPPPQEVIIVEATISLLSQEAIGIKTGYRPNHNFGDPENRDMFIGQIEFTNKECLYPGESHDVLVIFLGAPGLAEKMVVGNQWRIQEGLLLIGTGKIKRIIV
jgi:hypothetical protein